MEMQRILPPIITCYLRIALFFFIFFASSFFLTAQTPITGNTTITITDPGAFSYKLMDGCSATIQIEAIGGGGPGGDRTSANPNRNTAGGASGATLSCTEALSCGAAFSGAVGAGGIAGDTGTDGGDTNITLPSGASIAGGGKAFSGRARAGTAGVGSGACGPVNGAIGDPFGNTNRGNPGEGGDGAAGIGAGGTGGAIGANGQNAPATSFGSGGGGKGSGNTATISGNGASGRIIITISNFKCVPLSVSCPADPELAACSDAAAISAAYTTWSTGFSFSDGCDPAVTSGAIPILPTYVCGAAVSLSYTYEVTDDIGKETCMSTFSVAAATALSVSCPANQNLAACSDEAAINTAYTTWSTGFSFSDGCNGAVTSGAIPILPSYVCGAGVSLSHTYEVTDDCETKTCTSTFNVAAATALSVSCPANQNLAACSDEAAINTAYTTWSTGFSFSDGCNGAVTSGAIPILPSYVCGAGVSLSHTYEVTDDCETKTCTSTFNVAAATALSVSCPANQNLAACSDEAAINTAYTTWSTGFSFSDGCNGAVTSGAIPILPSYVCGAGVSLSHTYEVTDDCETKTCTSTFNVAAATALSVSCPANQNLAACSDEAAINTAYTTWSTGFSFSDGCNGAVTSGAIPILPSYVCGAGVSLSHTYEVTDDCETKTCTSTFNVAAATALSVSCPANQNLAACSDEAAINTAYTTWSTGFSFSDGCNGAVTSGAIPILPSYVCGAGVSLSYTYEVTDDCETKTCTSTFNVAAATALSVSCPANQNLAACSDEAAINTAYTTWSTGFSFSDGCNPSVTSGSIPILPSYVCGAAVSLSHTYEVTDDCGTKTCTSTFNVAAATALSVSCPANQNLAACSDEAAINTAYTTWSTGFSFSDGCNGAVTSGAIPILPSYVCGAGVSLSHTYEVTDDCETKTCTSTFNVAAATALSVSCPANQNLAACSDEAAINTAYTTWSTGFSFSDGCNGAVTSGAIPILPSYVCGAGVSLSHTYEVTDDCETKTCTSTFNVAAATALSVSCPANQNLAACSDEAAINTAYTTWSTGFSFSDGCNGAVTSGAIPILPSYVCGAGVSLSHTYEVTDDCETKTCTSTFNVAAATALSVSCPANQNLAACSDEAAINTAYITWSTGFSFSDGCNGAVTSGAIPILPSYVCGAGVSLSHTYEVTDDCETKTCTSTFNVAAATALSVSCPATATGIAGLSVADAIAGMNTWAAGASSSGGCSPEVITNNIPAVVDVCEGEVVPVTFSVTDDCGTKTCMVNFTIPPANPTITSTVTEVCVGSSISIAGSGTPASTNAYVSATATIATIDASTGVITPIAAGTTVITYTDANGCTVDVPVTVNPLPTLTSTGTICSADIKTYTITFTSDGTVTSTGGVVDNIAKTVSNIPSGTDVMLTATSASNCITMLDVTSPDCIGTANFAVNNTGGSMFMAKDPCVCRGDQVLNTDGTIVTSGTFDETVTVTGPPDLFVRIKSATGIIGGTLPIALTEDPANLGNYGVSLIHEDRLGYAITEFEFSTTGDENSYTTIMVPVGGGFTALGISNVCAYPQIACAAPLPATMDITDAPITLGANLNPLNMALPAFSNLSGFPQVTVNGVVTTSFNPAASPAIDGNNTIVVTYDFASDTGAGGTLTNPAIPTDRDNDPSNGVCPVSTIAKTITVAEPIPTMSQWGLMIFGLLILNLGLMLLYRKEEIQLIE